jgi:hypothetical protein
LVWGKIASMSNIVVKSRKGFFKGWYFKISDKDYALHLFRLIILINTEKNQFLFNLLTIIIAEALSSRVINSNLENLLISK